MTPATRHLRRLERELDLLSLTGVGIPAMAPALTELLGTLAGSTACGVAWLDEHGLPQGLHHRAARPETIELYANEYGRLFTGPGEISVTWLAQQKGHPVGKLLDPGPAYFRSNTHNLLFRANQHPHALDVRVDAGGRARAVFFLFRDEGHSFAESDRLRLERWLPSVQRAAIESEAGVAGRTRREGERGHVVLDGGGERIEFADEAARRLLAGATVVDHGISLTRLAERAPVFIRRLCAELHARALVQTTADRGRSVMVVASSTAPPRVEVDVPGGSLACEVRWLEAPAADASPPRADAPPANARRILATLVDRRPDGVRVARRIAALDLSPLQSRIALFAARGGARDACGAEHAVSKEALKKHLRHIYAVTGADDWDALAGRLVEATPGTA